MTNPNYTSANPTQKDQWSAYAKSNGLNSQGDNEVKPVLNHLSLIYGPEAEKQAWFSNSLGNQSRSAIQQLLDSLGQGSQASQMHAQQRGATENAANAAKQAQLFNAGSGLGSGYQAGNNAAIFDNAANQQNDISRYYGSPEHAMSVLQAILGGVNAGQQNPALQQLLAIYPDIFNSQQYNDAQSSKRGISGVVQQAAPILGAYAQSQTGGAAGGGARPQGQGGSTGPFQGATATPGYFDWNGWAQANGYGG